MTWVRIEEARDDSLPRISPGVVNRYRARVPSRSVHLVLLDARQPLANEPYVVEGLRVETSGTTDGSGAVRFDVPLDARDVRLHLTQRRRRYRIRVGHLDPLESASGVRMRLEHLGYLVRVDDVGAGGFEGADPWEWLREPLRWFQADHPPLVANGRCDAATRDALRNAHGC